MALFLLLIIAAGRPHCRPRLGGLAAPPKRQAPGPVTLAASRWLTGTITPPPGPGTQTLGSGAS